MTDIRTLHRSADLELADEGGIAPLSEPASASGSVYAIYEVPSKWTHTEVIAMDDDHEYLREPRRLTRLQDIDPWSLAGVGLLVLGAIGVAGVLAWAAAWVLRVVA